jgi:hypothetical protein
VSRAGGAKAAAGNIDCSTAARRETNRTECLVAATGTAGDVEMSFVVYVELAALAVDGFGNFVNPWRSKKESWIASRSLSSGGAALAMASINSSVPAV